MFLMKDGKKVWDKSKVYGYSDEVMCKGEPADNTVPVEGCNEILTEDDIYRMFPNQILLLELVAPNFSFANDKKAKVLWIHGDRTHFAALMHANNYPSNWMWIATYSSKVMGAFECLSI